MKAEQKLAGRSTVASSEPTVARSLDERASIGDDYGERADEFEADFALDDDAILDETDSDITDWCDAQEVVKELAGRAWC